MPIFYNKAEDTWELKDATEDEKNALIELAKNSIVEFFGDEVADKIMSRVAVMPSLETIPKDEMGNA